MKKITSFILAILMTFAVVSCSGSNTVEESKRPEAFDYELFTLGDTKFTYDYFRYLYSFIKSEYDGNKTEVTFDEIKEQIAQKVKRDKAIKDLLSAYSQSLTEEEITSCKEYIGLLQTSYGDSFESILEQEMKVTLEIFTDVTLKDYEYNKLYSYLADEKNNVLDYSESAILDYLKDFRSGMHIVLLKSSHDEKDAEEQIADIYTMALLDHAFEPFRSLHELGESMNTINESIGKITAQIEDGNNDASLTTNLAALTKQLSAVSEQINQKLKELNLDESLDNYIEKLSEYKKYLMGFVNESVDSKDAALVALLDSDIDALRKEIVSSIKEGISQALSAQATAIVNNKGEYGWIPDSLKTAFTAFNNDGSYDNAIGITELIAGNTELSKDANIVVLSESFKAYSAMLSEESTMYDVYTAVSDLNSTFKDIDMEKEMNMLLYASAKQAEITAISLKGVTENVFTTLEESYSKLSDIVISFEDLCIDYSDDYAEESDSVVYYFKTETLLPELASAVKDMKDGEISGIIKSTTGYHIIKLTTPDVDYFKKNDYPYYRLEDMISEKIEKIEETDDENFKALSEEKIAEFENEISSCLNPNTTAEPTDKPDNSNYLLITILVIAGTVAVVAVLAVLIITAGKPEGNPRAKKVQTNKEKDKTKDKDSKK